MYWSYTNVERAATARGDKGRPTGEEARCRARSGRRWRREANVRLAFHKGDDAVWRGGIAALRLTNRIQAVSRVRC
jgi:hypothetical protein